LRKSLLKGENKHTGVSAFLMALAVWQNPKSPYICDYSTMAISKLKVDIYRLSIINNLVIFIFITSINNSIDENSVP
jgi:hypothetical protein